MLAKTFDRTDEMAKEMMSESSGARNILFDIQYPQKVLDEYSENFFMSPSYVYRFDCANELEDLQISKYFSIQYASTQDEIDQLNDIYKSHNMAILHKGWFAKKPKSTEIIIIKENHTQKILAGVLCVNHCIETKKEENIGSLWSLAAKKNNGYKGIGAEILRYAIIWAQQKSLKTLKLSVLISNKKAISLYSKIGFTRETTMVIKNKTLINKPFIGETV